MKYHRTSYHNKTKRDSKRINGLKLSDINAEKEAYTVEGQQQDQDHHHHRESSESETDENVSGYLNTFLTYQ